MLKPTARVAASLGESGEQRAAILAAVQADVDRVGYRRIRLEDIARHAGVSRQTIYDYFGSRDALIRAFMAHESVRLAEVIAAAIEDERDPRRGLTKGLTTVLEWLSGRPSLQDPLREDFIRQRIALQYALGDRSAALQTYRRFAQDLKAELGVPPMAETQDLARLVLQDAPAHQVLGEQPRQQQTAAAAESTTLPGNVSALLRSLVGRADTVAEIVRILSADSPPSARLLTLTGPGGIGKTRLAQEVAFRLWQDRAKLYPDGWMTDAASGWCSAAWGD